MHTIPNLYYFFQAKKPGSPRKPAIYAKISPDDVLKIHGYSHVNCIFTNKQFLTRTENLSAGFLRRFIVPKGIPIGEIIFDYNEVLKAQ
ncbi:hypothetical protein ADM99_12040 [Leptolinea tardivitalis]|uniref:Uncharacterized protein n=1 Tax=Leptolinea tardivitalis TaxID=229920 RepID=A0A0P6XIM4_9CHLR|nr:hypothetical protein ADM99_12040 [Leptolinea tardivitalis]